MTGTQPRALLREWWLVVLLSTLVVLFLVYDRTAVRLDRMAYDLLLRLEKHSPDPRILLVTIDDDSLREVGPWPWPRETHALLVRAIAQGKPRSIGYDVLFLEPRQGDELLARAMEAAPPTFLPLAFGHSSRTGTRNVPIRPVPIIARTAKDLGHVNLASDEDGLARHALLFEDADAGNWPHLMVLMGGTSVDRRVSSNNNPLIAFAGQAGTFPTIKASSVLRGELPLELLRDRLVLVGATAQGLGDLHPTPFRLMSGLELHANLLDNLLSRRLINEGGPGWRVAMALMPLCLLLLAFRRLAPRGAILALMIIVTLSLATTVGLLLIGQFWVSPVTGLLALLLVYPLWGWRRLSSVSAYMLAELEGLRLEPDLLRAREQTAAPDGDPVTRQVLLLNDAIERLRETRRFVQDSLDQLPDAIFVVDENGCPQLSNRRGTELINGLFSQESDQSLAALFRQLRPTDGLADERPLHVRLAAYADGIHQLFARDGRCFEIRVKRREAAQGVPNGWLVTLTDVTVRWQVERQREMMMRFFTHDMRAPQISILATLDTSGDEEVATVADRIAGYARRTLNLADGFIQLARAESLSYQMELVNLPDLLLDALDELWPQLVAAGMTVETEGENQSLVVLAERSLLTRALINLIDNAIKYGASGKRLRCMISQQEVENRWTVACSITDWGPGITAEQYTRLFDPFQRGPEVGHGREHGAGLGLSFVRTVVTRHHGTVRCDSKEGQGATFTIALPLESEASLF